MKKKEVDKINTKDLEKWQELSELLCEENDFNSITWNNDTKEMEASVIEEMDLDEAIEKGVLQDADSIDLVFE